MKGIKLIRVGGLSPVKQTNKSAPEKKGVWAFVWPYYDLFFLGSTSAEGVNKKHSRYDQMKLEGWRRFIHKGKLYSRVNVPGSIEVGDWYCTTGVEYNKYLSKLFSLYFKDMRQYSMNNVRQHFGNTKTKKQMNDYLTPAGVNPWSFFSKDDMEVFVPRPEEKGF